MTTTQWAVAFFVLGCLGVFGWVVDRIGYLRGWKDCARRDRERHQVNQMRKTFDLELERMKRRRR